MAEERMEQLDLFEFDKPVIKGAPQLRWTGKRPFESTQFFPAQLKERFGEADQDGWFNKIFWGDNLQVMSHLLREFRGKVDLIYIDPPFDSKADYKKRIQLRGKNVVGDSSTFEEKQYSDIWSNDEYLQFMYERLILCRELLSDTGSIYVHMDEKRASYLRVILDEVFGPANFRREIIWDITVLSGFKSKANNWIRGHDVILYYGKSSASVKFNKLFQAQSQKYIARFNKIDEEGRRYFDGRGERRYLDDVLAKGKPFGDVWADVLSFQALRNELGELTNYSELQELLSELATFRILAYVWGDIMSFQQIPTAVENSGYPTQKPEALLDRIIRSATDEGDLVFDCFMGSGTTQAVAQKLNRRFIGADINLGAIQTATKRLLSIIQDTGLLNYNRTGFEVYNVNNYDFFRNPIEARDLIIEALCIQRFSSNTTFDGELDGRNVKILPINRIATKADLAELVANLPYKSYEKAKEENPHDPVDRITLVCMGHEPDLAAGFQQMVGAYKIDVEIVDILRDKSALELKRDSQADIVIKHGKVIIRQFFPMNLMQKLSLQKENVDDWKQLVDSIMIDYDYDGSVLNPQIIDVPEKNEVVHGEYSIPKEHGRIRVKITDLLSESLEIEVCEDA